MADIREKNYLAVLQSAIQKMYISISTKLFFVYNYLDKIFIGQYGAISTEEAVSLYYIYAKQPMT